MRTAARGSKEQLSGEWDKSTSKAAHFSVPRLRCESPLASNTLTDAHRHTLHATRSKAFLCGNTHSHCIACIDNTPTHTAGQPQHEEESAPQTRKA